MTTIADRYVIERELGRGGMATVMLARDLVHDRPVAIKLLRTELAGAVSHQRFLREMRVAAQLQHPHIVPLFDSGVADGVPFYVMPYIGGESVRARLDREKQLPVADAVQIATDIASALGYAHAQGIVHRDIKPENILLSDGQALVADFGIAHAVTEAAGERLTSTGLAVGTPEYMSPEQASGEHEVDGRTDIYSLGCVLFEMLAGIPPFVGPTPQAVIARRLSSDAPPVRELRASVPDAIANAVAKSLERVPGDRYRDAAEFAAALTAEGATYRRLGRHRSWLRWAAVTGAVVVAGAVVVVGARRVARTAPTPTQRVVRAKRALADLQLPSALQELKIAVTQDPSNVEANLWLAQVGAMLGGDSAPEWRRAARLAAHSGAQLDSVSQLRSQALVALAEDRTADACNGFRRVVSVAPADFPALLTLADCMVNDRAVVRDSRSPSGWRYRNSPHSAVRLYQQLIREYPAIAPARAIVFARLSDLLFASPNVYRRGYGADKPELQFGAFASVQGDTLVFVPYPLSELHVGAKGAEASASFSGLSRERVILRNVAEQWARDFPRDPMAHEALAAALEADGNIGPTARGTPSALAEILTARTLVDRTAMSATRLGLDVSFVRLLVKAGRFREVRAFADSVFQEWEHPDLDEADSLIGIAGLTGRLRKAVDLSKIGDVADSITLPQGRSYHVPVPLARIALEFNGYATLGGPGDSVRALRDRLESMLPSYTSADEREAVRDALLGRGLSMAAPVIGPDALRRINSRGNHIIQLEQRLAEGDRAGIESDMRRLEQLRKGAWPGSTSVDATYAEAWVRASAGDTAGALAQLDQTLNALPSVSNQMLADLFLAGSVPRLMMLRVDLSRRGDPSRPQWAAAVCELWQSADALLQATRERMCRAAQPAS